jgi:CubicO group peptidase (beta-lactamase class C family)
LPFTTDEVPAFEESLPYSEQDLYGFLARYDLPRDIGSDWNYSNLGYWLLSEALASRAGMDYEDLLRIRVLAPLGLKSTAFTLMPKQKARLAPGYNAVLQPAPAFSSIPSMAVMPAAGGLLSTANDLLSFLRACLEHERSSLAPAMAEMLNSRRRAGRRSEQGLGWIVIGEPEDQLIAHDGGTLGYASSLVWDPNLRIGIVVLSNQLSGVSDIARHLLRPQLPLEKPTATRRTEIVLPAAVLESYIGRYQAEGEGGFLIVLQGSYLSIQSPAEWGLPKLRLRPEGLRDFFVAELPLRVRFQTDHKKRVTGVLIYPPRGQSAVAALRKD